MSHETMYYNNTCISISMHFGYETNDNQKSQNQNLRSDREQDTPKPHEKKPFSFRENCFYHCGEAERKGLENTL